VAAWMSSTSSWSRSKARDVMQRCSRGKCAEAGMVKRSGVGMFSTSSSSSSSSSAGRAIRSSSIDVTDSRHLKRGMYQCRKQPAVRVRAASSSPADVVVEEKKKDNGTPIQRYVASNRFAINPAAAAKFESRWATRKSRLAVLDGFRFFTLMRLVDDPLKTADNPSAAELAAYNYVSFTIWSNKANFNSWRTGEAFKEAHGGGTIFGFMDMLVNSIGVLKGPPKPVFYNGLLPTARTPKVDGDRVVDGGWRVVEANGKDKIDAEVFGGVISFQLNAGREDAYETFWSRAMNDESTCKSAESFVCSLLMRRDNKVKMHGSEDASKLPPGTGYSVFAFFEDKSDVDAWKADTLSRVLDFGKDCENAFHSAPATATYEGVLVLENPDLGA